MNLRSLLPHAAFGAGLAAIGWVGSGYVGDSPHPLALAMTALIAAFYVAGAVELQRFHRATQGLAGALAALPAAEPLPALGPWLEAHVPAALRNAVRLRVEGERGGLPGPALTPYLAGLLVLLGMLGTFLGMVVTLHGTGLALDGAADLAAIRTSLAAPVKGLGLAFGTSVAGVAASAMLGLMSAWRRRERLQVAQRLEGRLATTLRAFTPAHQREEQLRLLQQQAQGLPALVAQLQAMAERMERHSEALNERIEQRHEALDTRLLAGHERLAGLTETAMTSLAASVDRSLQHSLAEGARLAGATLQPAVQATLAGLAREASATQARLAETAQAQLDTLCARFEASAAAGAQQHQAALARHEQANAAIAGALGAALEAHAATFEQRAAALVETVARSHTDTQAAAATRDEQRLAAWARELAAMTASLQQAWQHAGEQAQAQQQRVCAALEATAQEVAAQSQAQTREVVAHAQAQARDTIAEVQRLAQTAAEAPRAAAEAMAELRERLAESAARDNALLDERARVLQTLDVLLGAVNHAATEQRQAVDALVATSGELLERVGGRFAEQVQAQSRALEDVAAQVTGGAVEVASLGEAFGHAVTLFAESNDKLVAHLERVEGALSKSMARSDEQLAYYVAQAREVIDLSLMSQKQVIDDLQQIAAAARPPRREPEPSAA